MGRHYTIQERQRVTKPRMKLLLLKSCLLNIDRKLLVIILSILILFSFKSEEYKEKIGIISYKYNAKWNVPFVSKN